MRITCCSDVFLPMVIDNAGSGYRFICPLCKKTGTISENDEKKARKDLLVVASENGKSGSCCCGQTAAKYTQARLFQDGRVINQQEAHTCLDCFKDFYQRYCCIWGVPANSPLLILR